MNAIYSLSFTGEIGVLTVKPVDDSGSSRITLALSLYDLSGALLSLFPDLGLPEPQDLLDKTAEEMLILSEIACKNTYKILVSKPKDSIKDQQHGKGDMNMVELMRQELYYNIHGTTDPVKLDIERRQTFSLERLILEDNPIYDRISTSFQNMARIFVCATGILRVIENSSKLPCWSPDLREMLTYIDNVISLYNSPWPNIMADFPKNYNKTKINPPSPTWHSTSLFHLVPKEVNWLLNMGILAKVCRACGKLFPLGHQKTKQTCYNTSCANKWREILAIKRLGSIEAVRAAASERKQQSRKR